MDEWTKKTWDIYTKEYHSALKMKEILPFVMTWMNLVGIMLNEISCKEEIQILHGITYMWNLKKFKLIEIESRMVIVRN